MKNTFILEARNVNKRFGGVIAANDVNLQVKPGELRCIIGPNGAGNRHCFHFCVVFNALTVVKYLFTSMTLLTNSNSSVSDLA